MARTIVVGVDHAAASTRAVSWAARYARRNLLDVDAVHVLTYSAEFARDLSFAGLTSWRRDLRRRLEENWIQPLREFGVPYRTHLVEDDTIELGLIGIADRMDAELIVLGAPGHHQLTNRLIGSVVDRIIHRANRPVAIVLASYPLRDDECDLRARPAVECVGSAASAGSSGPMIVAGDSGASARATDGLQNCPPVGLAGG